MKFLFNSIPFSIHFFIVQKICEHMTLLLQITQLAESKSDCPHVVEGVAFG